MIPPLLAGTTRIGTMPSRLVKHFQRMIPLRIAESPQPFPTFTEAVQWTVRHNSDPESVWMREILLQEAARMASTREERFIINASDQADTGADFAESGSPLS